MFIKLAFLPFRRDANLAFDRGIADRHEMPWLQIRPARRRSRRLNARFNHLPPHGPLRKMPNCPPPLHPFIKLAGPPQQLLIRDIPNSRRRHQPGKVRRSITSTRTQTQLFKSSVPLSGVRLQVRRGGYPLSGLDFPRVPVSQFSSEFCPCLV
jgi:hypothetical protein